MSALRNAAIHWYRKVFGAPAGSDIRDEGLDCVLDGNTAVELAENSTFEETAYLLGELTNRLTTAQIAVDSMVGITNNWQFERPKTHWSRVRKENIIEQEAKRKKELPGPTTYKSKQEWLKGKQ